MLRTSRNRSFLWHFGTGLGLMRRAADAVVPLALTAAMTLVT